MGADGSAASPSTRGVSLACQIVRSSLRGGSGANNTVPVMLPRRGHPLYLLPSRRGQPWGLLPMKAAAYAEYPNIFNNACTLFSSINRDVKLGRPSSIVRVSKVCTMGTPHACAHLRAALMHVHTFITLLLLRLLLMHRWLWIWQKCFATWA